MGGCVWDRSGGMSVTFGKCSKELKQQIFLGKYMFQSGYVQFFASAMEANAYPLRFIRQSQGVSSTYHLLKISKSSLFPSKAGKTLSSLSFSLSYQIHTNSRQSMSGNSDLRLNLNLIFCLEEFLDTTSDTTFRKI